MRTLDMGRHATVELSLYLRGIAQSVKLFPVQTTKHFRSFLTDRGAVNGTIVHRREYF